MPNVHGNDFIAYVDHTRKSFSNKECTSTISQNLSGSLSKPWIFIGDGSICEDSTWEQSPNHFKISPLHCDVSSWHHANFQPLLTYFPIIFWEIVEVYSLFEHDIFCMINIHYQIIDMQVWHFPGFICYI